MANSGKCEEPRVLGPILKWQLRSNTKQFQYKFTSPHPLFPFSHHFNSSFQVPPLTSHSSFFLLYQKHGPDPKLKNPATLPPAPLLIRQCSKCDSVYPGKSLQLHSLARHTFRQGCRHSRRRRFRPGTRFGSPAHRAGRLVRQLLGPDRVQLRRLRCRKMHHRRLRRRTEVHRRRCSAGDPGGVHHRKRQQRQQGLLRREPCRRLQCGQLGIGVRATGGTGDCQYAGCVADVSGVCPVELQVRDGAGSVVACKSACAAFNTAEFCCTGDHSTPQTCSPTHHSEIFKKACPTAYSYAYDDASSTCTCSGSDYRITFCPTGSS
ncbi:hypothetical protein JHK87_039065 [Glycine soja]|nr:hypothetical protein JHK87_039065 [Glycine soja]